MDRALKFYCNLLGLHIQSKSYEKGEFISKILSNENIDFKHIEVNTVKLSADDNSTRIELLEFKNIKNLNNKYILFQVGFSHISLTVKNLDELYLRLKKANIEFNSPPAITPNKNLKITFCKDFEGNYLELIEEISNKN